MDKKGYFGIIRVDCEGGDPDALVHAQPQMVVWDDMIKMANRMDEKVGQSSPYRHFPTRLSDDEYQMLFGARVPESLWKRILKRLEAMAFGSPPK